MAKYYHSDILDNPKFIAFKGVPNTTVRKRCFTKALKKIVQDCKCNVIVSADGTIIESIAIGKNNASAAFILPVTLDGETKSTAIECNIVASHTLMKPNNWKISASSEKQFVSILKQIIDILESADKASLANRKLSDCMRQCSNIKGLEPN